MDEYCGDFYSAEDGGWDLPGAVDVEEWRGSECDSIYGADGEARAGYVYVEQCYADEAGGLYFSLRQYGGAGAVGDDVRYRGGADAGSEFPKLVSERVGAGGAGDSV